MFVALKVIEKIVQENSEFIRKRGAKASFGPLMGIIMRDYRGKVNAERVSEMLKKALERFA